MWRETEWQLSLTKKKKRKAHKPTAFSLSHHQRHTQTQAWTHTYSHTHTHTHTRLSSSITWHSHCCPEDINKRPVCTPTHKSLQLLLRGGFNEPAGADHIPSTHLDCRACRPLLTAAAAAVAAAAAAAAAVKLRALRSISCVLVFSVATPKGGSQEIDHTERERERERRERGRETERGRERGRDRGREGERVRDNYVFVFLKWMELLASWGGV